MSGATTTKEKKPARTKKAKGEVVHGIKGFDSNLKCREYQFEVGKTYEHGGPVRLCSSGFHFIEGNPLDVLDFYPLIGSDGSLNRFCAVEAHGEIGREKGQSKAVAAKLSIKAELKLPDVIASAIRFAMDACKGGGEIFQAASGYSSQLAASGDCSKLAASGYSSQLAASGNYSNLEVKGAFSSVAAVGRNSTIRAVAGTPVAICEYDRNGKPIGFATGIAGEDGVPADTWLTAKGGKLVEAA